jgi:hypothetical protein
LTIILSTFPYYGGRFYRLKEIIKILEELEEEFDVVMDVFRTSYKES